MTHKEHAKVWREATDKMLTQVENTPVGEYHAALLANAQMLRLIYHAYENQAPEND